MSLVVFCLGFLASFVSAFISSDEVTSLPGWDGPLASKQYSGLLSVPNTNPTRYYHYWLVTSENDPVNDPIVFWFNGGPGSSSLWGYFTEQGPYNLNQLSLEYNDTEVPVLFYNNYTWAKISNIVFLESPAGVGFSYCDGPDGPINSCPDWNDTLVAEDNHAILQQFFSHYSEYMQNDFYITGESYAGIYVPTLVMQIENDPSGIPPLKGFAVGDGCMGIGGMGGCNLDDNQNFFQFMWGHGQISNDMYNQLLNDCGNCLEYGNCSSKNTACTNSLNEANNMLGGYNVYNIYDECYLEGNNMMSMNSNGEISKYQKPQIYKSQKYGIKFNLEASYNSKRYVYNHYDKSNGIGPDQYTCGESKAVRTYLALDEVMEAINVKNMPWVSQDGDWDKYHSTQTDLRPYYYKWVQKYRILIYYGDVDSAVNYVGGEKWTENLGYPILEAWRPWTQNGFNLMGGYVQVYDTNGTNFTFLTVRGAGHQVPQYKPSQALSMYYFYLNDMPYPPFVGIPQAQL